MQDPAPKGCDGDEAKEAVANVMEPIERYREMGFRLDENHSPHPDFNPELSDEQINDLKANFHFAYYKMQLLRDYVYQAPTLPEVLADPEERDLLDGMVKTPYAKCLQNLSGSNVISRDDLIYLLQDDIAWDHKFTVANIVKVDLKEQIGFDKQGNPVYSDQHLENRWNRRYITLFLFMKKNAKTEASRQKMQGCLDLLSDPKAVNEETRMLGDKEPAMNSNLPRESPRSGAARQP
jgi:hypothetical protein